MTLTEDRVIKGKDNIFIKGQKVEVILETYDSKMRVGFKMKKDKNIYWVEEYTDFMTPHKFTVNLNNKETEMTLYVDED